MKTVLKCRNLYKDFDGVTVLKDIDLTVQEGEFVAIMGHSGSGKSTLLYAISGMDQPTAGQVLIGEEDLSQMKDEEISQVRLKKMGFIFQHSHLLKKLSIRDNVVLPGLKASKDKGEREKACLRGEELLKKTGIEAIADQDIKKVSGGQLQRAAICRALINEPEILFGDEPTGALNSRAAKEVMDILNDINREGTTIILVTHDMKVAARADRILFIQDGIIHDQLEIGKYTGQEETLPSREKQVWTWLEQKGF